jgi:hypothetical protein
MVLDTSFLTALFCISCDRAHVEEFSLFDFIKGSTQRIICDCGNHLGKIKITQRKYYRVSIWRPFYEDYHTKCLSWADFRSGWLLELADYSSERCSFVGAKQAVREGILRQENFLTEKESLFDEFADSQVMFEILNKVDDLAVSGSICCGCCGENDISIEVFDGFIMLFCSHCGNMYKIKAVNKEDAQKIKSVRFIELGHY